MKNKNILSIWKKIFKKKNNINLPNETDLNLVNSSYKKESYINIIKNFSEYFFSETDINMYYFLTLL